MIKLKKQNIKFAEDGTYLNYDYETAVEFFEEVNRIQKEEGAAVTIVTEKPYAYSEPSDGSDRVVEVPAFWGKTKEGDDIVIYPCQFDFDREHFIIPHKKSMKDTVWTFDILNEFKVIDDCMIDEDPMEVFIDFIERAGGTN